MSSPPFFPTSTSKTGAGTTITVRFNNGNSTDTPQFVVGYWSIRGLGAPLRAMLCAAKVDHTNLLYDIVEDGNGRWKSDYFSAKPEIRSKYSCALMNLPFVVDQERERVICQTNACVANIGRQLGMMGRNETEQSVCEELLCEIYDLRNVMIGFAYESGDKQAALKGATPHLRKLEMFLTFKKEKAEKKKLVIELVPHHLVGTTLTAPDFHLYEMLDQWTALEPESLSGYPCLQAFKLGFENMEENQFYLNSWLHKKLPINNCMAKFASAPDAKVFKLGQTADWRGKGDITMSTLVRVKDSMAIVKVQNGRGEKERTIPPTSVFG